MNIAIVTGSGGLVGSEAAIFLNNKNYKVIGIDNDFRKYFFGKNASTKKRTDFLKKTIKNFVSKSIDIRNYGSLEKLFKNIKIKLKLLCMPPHSHRMIGQQKSLSQILE